MIHPEWNDTLTVRSVFVIDNNKKIRLMLTYPASTGRNFQEILRAIDSLQLTDKYQVATPADWKQGEDCIIVPALQDRESSQRKIPEGLQSREAIPAHHARSEQVGAASRHIREEKAALQREPLFVFIAYKEAHDEDSTIYTPTDRNGDHSPI